MTSLGPSLPAEVWLRIIDHLRRPLPTPNGRNDRSSVMQPDLVVIMRVNKLFNNLTSLPLYRSVVTDHLPSLVYNLDGPAATSGVKSKSDLISSIVALHLEYFDKSPSYTTIMAAKSGSYWMLVGMNLDELCEIESENLAEGAGWLLDGDTIRLASCRTISTGAFLDGQTDIWEGVSKSKPNYLNAITAARGYITNLTAVPVVKSYCHRVQYGPLAYAAMAWVNNSENIRAEHDTGTRTHRAHMEHPSALKSLPTVVGNTSQWYCQFKKKTFTVGNDGGLLLAVANRIHAREYTRASFEQRSEGGDYSQNPPISVDIFLPAAVYSRGGRKRFEDAIASMVLYTLEKEYGVVGSAALDVKYANHWNLKEIESAPTCQACGWCVDDL